MKHLMKLKRRAKRAARRQKEAAEASTSAVETVEINEEWEVNSISDSDSDSDSVVVVGPEGAQEQEPEDAQVCRIFTRFAPCLWRVVEVFRWWKVSKTTLKFKINLEWSLD